MQSFIKNIIIVSIISIRYAINLRNYLQEFIAVSKKISNKEFHAKINISAKGELGQLVDNFNDMIDTIDITIQEVLYIFYSDALCHLFCNDFILFHLPDCFF